MPLCYRNHLPNLACSKYSLWRKTCTQMVNSFILFMKARLSFHCWLYALTFQRYKKKRHKGFPNKRCFFEYPVFPVDIAFEVVIFNPWKINKIQWKLFSSKNHLDWSKPVTFGTRKIQDLVLKSLSIWWRSMELTFRKMGLEQQLRWMDGAIEMWIISFLSVTR